ncbi:MAG: amidohydrolase family protein [Terriglobia bacterium]
MRRRVFLLVCWILLLLLLVPLTAYTQKAPAGKLALVGGRLIDGNEGPPLENSVIVVEGNRIVAVGQRGAVTVPPDARLISTEGMTVLPGLIDMHVHLFILGHGDYSQWDPTYKNRMPEVMKISARQLLLAGVTSARDLGGPLNDSIAIRDAINRGELVGPRMFVTGPFITRELSGSTETYFQRLIHSPDEARAAAREFLAAGVDGLKAWIGLTEEDIHAIVEEAHAQGKWVSSHARSDAKVRASIRAGVDTLEHFCGGRKPLCADDVIEAMAEGAVRLAPPGGPTEVWAERNVWVVPTLIVSKIYDLTQAFPERRDHPRLKADLPADIYADVRQSIAHPERLGYFENAKATNPYLPGKFRQLVDANLRLLIGSDSGTPMNFHYESTRYEMKFFVDYGVPPLQTISAATRLAAQALGVADRLGTVEPGKLADIIVVDGNPLETMEALRNVVHVIKDGVVYK